MHFRRINAVVVVVRVWIAMTENESHCWVVLPIEVQVMKITNPEDIFTTQEDKEQYEKSKEVLIKLKFVKL